MELSWNNTVPQAAGIYLRKNPLAGSVVRCDVLERCKQLYVNIDGSLALLSAWPSAADMLWFGPIPRPPAEPERCSIVQAPFAELPDPEDVPCDSGAVE